MTNYPRIGSRHKTEEIDEEREKRERTESPGIAGLRNSAGCTQFMETRNAPPRPLFHAFFRPEDLDGPRFPSRQVFFTELAAVAAAAI